MEHQLFDAIKAGKTDEVRELVKADPALTKARDASGASAILVAAYNMKPDVVTALVGPVSCTVAPGTSIPV